MSSAAVAHRSRWGFHPCSYETFRKLKRLHSRYWQTVAAVAEFRRWERKQPQNRVVRRWLRDGQGRRHGFEIVGPRPEPRYCPLFAERHRWHGVMPADRGVVAAYRAARRPQTEEFVPPLALTEGEIDKLLAEVEAWFAGRAA